jgi:prophage regulatory protein
MAKRATPARREVAPELQIITTEELTVRLQADETTIKRWVKAGSFPPPLRLGPNKIGWRLGVIDQWLKDREGNQ